MYLLRHVVPEGHQTAVFVATKHHVEYLNLVSTWRCGRVNLVSCDNVVSSTASSRVIHEIDADLFDALDDEELLLCCYVAYVCVM